MMVQVLIETFSASLLIPFLNSMQNINNSSGSINIFLEFFLKLFPGNIQDQFISILIVMISLMALSQIILIVNNKYILNFSAFTVQKKVSVNTFNKILNSQIKFIYTKRSGNLINNLTNDVNRSYNCIKGLLDLLSCVLFIIGYFIVGFWILPSFTLTLLIFMIGIALIAKKLLPYINNLGRKNVESQEDANNSIV